MTSITDIPGMKQLWNETRGEPEICIAVLDGPVDKNHSCFKGADLTPVSTLVSATPGHGLMSQHGTHITSVIFGQPESPVLGIAPKCRGLIVPVFSDNQSAPLSQLDLTRAIQQAVAEGAHIINVSGGQLAPAGQADSILANTVRDCAKNNVLIIAAAGNDGCNCLHVPAALPSVLAVGAMDAQGKPFDFSNWGENYQTQGILAPGDDILGALPGEGTTRLSGTSFATPIVSGVAALLLSIQLKQGKPPDPGAVRAALLNSALRCNPQTISDCRRFLAGSLNIPEAYASIIETGGKKIMSQQSTETKVLDKVSASLAEEGIQPSEAYNLLEEEETNSLPDISEHMMEVATTATPMASNVTTITPSQTAVKHNNCGCNGNQPKSLVYALGTLGYDFGTEARRDTFKQLMPYTKEGIPPNPYVAEQMINYLEENPSEAAFLIWTLNIELTPIYAIEPMGSFDYEVYKTLCSFLEGQIQPENSENFISRVSIPGLLSSKTVRLFSGQIVPVITPKTRGMYAWNVNTLVNATFKSAKVAKEVEDTIAGSMKDFLNRIYHDIRNLGSAPQERALNYAATNAFQAAQVWTEAGARGLQLDVIEVERSPFCRQDSDCWDVKLKFFDPENDRRAKKVYRFTIDVSDMMPVTVGEVRSWSVSN